MAAVDKIIERVPYSDGGFRRRISAGAVVSIGALANWIIEANISIKDLAPLKDVASISFVAIVILLIVYALGGLVEVVAELFVSRLTGNTVWAFVSPLYMYERYPKIIRYFLRAITFYPGFGLLLYYHWGKALIGKSSYQWRNLEKQLRPSARKKFKQYPEVVKDGLREPFGKYGDVPWRFFCVDGKFEDVKALARKLETRNKDILVILTSLIISVSLYSPIASKPPSMGAAVGFDIVFYIQIAMIIFAIFVGSYFLLLRQSILTIIEYKSLDRH